MAWGGGALPAPLAAAAEGAAAAAGAPPSPFTTASSALQWQREYALARAQRDELGGAEGSTTCKAGSQGAPPPRWTLGATLAPPPLRGTIHRHSRGEIGQCPQRIQGLQLLVIVLSGC